MLPSAMCVILGPYIFLSTTFSKSPQCVLSFQGDEAKLHTRIKKVKGVRNCLIIICYLKLEVCVYEFGSCRMMGNIKWVEFVDRVIQEVCSIIMLLYSEI